MYIANNTKKVNIAHFANGEYKIEKVSQLPHADPSWEFAFYDKQAVENFNCLEKFVCTKDNQVVGFLCGTNGTDTNLSAPIA